MQNYFEFYGLPIQLNLDLALLKQKFFEISRNSHPDLFANATPSEQEKALEISTLNTVAYKTLLHQHSRIEHILHLYHTDSNQNLPPVFLGEMMDMNERIDEATPETKEQLTQEIAQLKKDFEVEMHQLFEQFDNAKEIDRASILLTLNQLHLKNKYLLRLNERHDTFAAE